MDFELMVEYFVLAWTFDGFVRPGAVWVLSLILFFLVVGIYWVIAIRKGRDTEYISISIKKEESSE
jgi:hypothetical protein